MRAQDAATELAFHRAASYILQAAVDEGRDLTLRERATMLTLYAHHWGPQSEDEDAGDDLLDQASELDRRADEK